MSGVAKKVGGALGLTSTQPKYDIGKAVQTENFGINSSLGNRDLKQNPDGTWTLNYADSMADQTRNQLINQGLGGLSLDPTDATDSYYQAMTRLLLPQMERQTKSLDNNLINRGIQVGNEQYSTAMGDLHDQQQGQLNDISNQAIFQGQNLLGSQIGNINSLSSGRDIYAIPSMGGGSNAYNSQYQAASNRASDSQGGFNQLLGTGLGIGSLALLSDGRLKENLKKVGQLDNGLNVYIGNYKEETGLDTTPQLFLIAQEVEEVKPEAIVNIGEFMAVDYSKATEV